MSGGEGDALFAARFTPRPEESKALHRARAEALRVRAVALPSSSAERAALEADSRAAADRAARSRVLRAEDLQRARRSFGDG